MKTQLIKILACCALVLPLSEAQAAGAGKMFGGFRVKQTFSLKVTGTSSNKTVGSQVTKSPVPAGIPKFKVNQTVKFTIGKQGQLTGPGFSIPFNKAASTAAGNNYTNVRKGSKESPINALVLKNSAIDTVAPGAPASVSMLFSKYTVKGTTVTTYSVGYQFE